jgi:hypothetical protein
LGKCLEAPHDRQQFQPVATDVCFDIFRKERLAAADRLQSEMPLEIAGGLVDRFRK